VNQPRFLGAGMTRGRMPVWSTSAQEVAAVLGFARRAGRDGDNLIHAMRFGQTPEFGEHLEPGMHSLRRERTPSRPPAPRRTIAFSRSMISNEKSGRISTTIMWIELVPMSIAATACAYYNDSFRPVRLHGHCCSPSELLKTRLERFSRAMRGIEQATSDALHARASRRALRELVPVLRCRRRRQETQPSSPQGHQRLARSASST
jgi:hypothetical protein